MPAQVFKIDFNKYAPIVYSVPDNTILGAYYTRLLCKTVESFFTWGDLKRRLDNPSKTEKAQSPIINPSLATSKTNIALLEYENQNGHVMSCLWADVDDGSPSLASMIHKTEQLGVCAAIYSSPSARRVKDNVLRGDRWRVMFPMAAPMRLDDWKLKQKALAQYYGGDIAASRMHQPIYLPANADGGYYEYRIVDGELWHPGYDPATITNIVTSIAQAQAEAERKAAEKAKLAPLARKAGGEGASVIDRVVTNYSMRYVLESYGYERDGRRYIHPQSTSKTAGVVMLEDGGVEYYYSHHGSDPLADGHRHDVFDLIVQHEFNGDAKAAVKTYADKVFTEQEKQQQKQEWKVKKQQEEKEQLKNKKQNTGINDEQEHNGDVVISNLKGSGRFSKVDDLLEEEFKEINWAIEGLLPEGLAVLSGPPKLGKSWLSLDFCLSIVTGGLAASQFVTEKGSVLLCALEDNKRRLKSRISMRRGAGMKFNLSGPLDFNVLADPKLPRFYYTTELPRLDEGGMQELTAFLDDNPDCKLIVLDTLAKVKPVPKGKGNAYENDYLDMGAVQRLALDRHCCILLITHNRKTETDDPLQSISGSTGITGVMDTILLLTRKRGAANAALMVTGRDVSEHTWAMSFDGEHGAWTVVGDSEVSGDSEKAEILKALKEINETTGRGAGPKQIWEFMGGEHLAPKLSTIKTTLYRGFNDGILTNTKGQYAVK